jgi:hypothetical protein
MASISVPMLGYDTGLHPEHVEAKRLVMLAVTARPWHLRIVLKQLKQLKR